ncbi:MAG TPA: MraY family glycosyltransferase [Rhizomicrobium sp.]|nr:MraY family glycosyltransferase [Rhizomicrobium sp.]
MTAYLFLATAAATAALCLLARSTADWLKVFDYPRGGRKGHAQPTPQTGGLAILFPVLLWLLVQWFVDPQQPLYLALLLSVAGIGLVGIMDDQSHLSANGRLLLLAVFTLIVFALDPQMIPKAIPWGFGDTAISKPLFIVGAIMATAGFVSSVNMADGIDGLVPSALLIWCVGFDIFADAPVRLVSLALTGPVGVVLVFNLRGRIFLGDCGTFGLGFVTAILALASLRSGHLKAETLLVWFAMPVLDCLRVIAARLLRGRSPFRGGKDHFHHILADVFGRRRALYVYVATIFGTSAVATLVPDASVYILVGLTAACLGFVGARRVLFQRQQAKLLRDAPRTIGRGRSNLFRTYGRAAAKRNPPITMS